MTRPFSFPLAKPLVFFIPFTLLLLGLGKAHATPFCPETGCIEDTSALVQMGSWHGPNFHRNGSPLSKFKLNRDNIYFQVPMGPGLMYSGEWRQEDLAFGYAKDSLGGAWTHASRLLDHTLRLRWHDRYAFTGHLAMPLTPGTNNHAAGFAFEVHGAFWQMRLATEWQRGQEFLQVEVPGYQTVTAQSNAENRRVTANLHYGGPRLDLTWTGTLNHIAGAPATEPDFAVMQRAWLGQQGGSVTVQNLQDAFPWRMGLQGEGIMGNGHGIGHRGKGSVTDPFAWVPWELQGFKGSVKAETPRSKLLLGCQADAGLLTVTLLRPVAPQGRWLWNRNQILDAYQGSLTGLFSRETWLGTGELKSHFWGGLGYGQHRWAFGNGYWEPRMELGLHRVDIGGWAHWTKRQTDLLISTRETSDSLTQKSVHRWLLHPGLSLNLKLGPITFKGDVSQLIPVDGFSWKSLSGSSAAETSSAWQGGLSFGLQTTVQLFR